MSDKKLDPVDVYIAMREQSADDDRRRAIFWAVCMGIYLLAFLAGLLKGYLQS